jgi:hypothetical protein
MDYVWEREVPIEAATYEVEYVLVAEMVLSNLFDFAATCLLQIVADVTDVHELTKIACSIMPDANFVTVSAIGTDDHDEKMAFHELRAPRCRHTTTLRYSSEYEHGFALVDSDRQLFNNIMIADDLPYRLELRGGPELPSIFHVDYDFSFARCEEDAKLDGEYNALAQIGVSRGQRYVCKSNSPARHV